MIKAAIIGGSGYVGGELLRLLWFHPKVKVVTVTAGSHTGEPVSSIHPNLTKICNLKFTKENLKEISKTADVVFLALPHGISMGKVKDINLKKTKVIDMGADFRLKNLETFEKVYKTRHLQPENLVKAVYGLSELNLEKIKKAEIVACPGCFPTGALLALFPVAKKGLLSGKVIIDSKTGSSGSGIKLSAGSHHPERANDFKAYNIFSHRHFWEIEETLSNLQGTKVDMVFTAHSAPMVRGIFTTAYVFLDKSFEEKEIKKIYSEAYKNKPFIRLVPSPHVSVVSCTNYCDIGIYIKGKTLIVTSAIDNLVKGSAGQAVQNMNIMFGFPENIGLTFPGSHP
ncbi:MAG: N-acetyl-gamma-glutamyl-phosphate reductase [Candidatus Gottesmanbacteria bacterium GW2011_GWC2_39_8]|uniref:N-acetyl-gamma-glutamyl-phosphate reductase n=1 Tax=Candidatus Gottesmanbacteria bacterium GW2011_GWC2_39_8 TaxID=1618450 RepID=A0A0G0PWK5_9BACT|nr:MAG: N-acetyl-gamma-glutamyl-phosphate reductase [Candidatus Gottesmanbacteria bacterium GW2011_GWC2_39_8]